MSNYCFGNEISFLFSVPNKYLIIAEGGISSYPKITPPTHHFLQLTSFLTQRVSLTFLVLWYV